MAVIKRVRVELSGSSVVGPGVSTFYFEGDDEIGSASLRAMYGAIAAYFPAQTRIDCPSVGELLDSQNGDVVGSWTEIVGSMLSGSGPNVYAAGVGVRLTWQTNARTNNRRVRGTTFLVPTTLNVWGDDGMLATGVAGAIGAAADGLLAAVGPNMLIWHRPVAGAGGGVSTVLGADVERKVSWLASRKH